MRRPRTAVVVAFRGDIWRLWLADSVPSLALAALGAEFVSALCRFNAANEEIEKLRAEVGAKEGEVSSYAAAEQRHVGGGWLGGWKGQQQRTACALGSLSRLLSSSPHHSTSERYLQTLAHLTTLLSCPQVRDAKQAEQEFAAECERLDREFAQERQRLQVRWRG